MNMPLNDSHLGRVLERIEELAGGSNKKKGTLFEELCKHFLENDDEFNNCYRRVWLWNEWPENGNYPDTGIDIVAEMREQLGRCMRIKCDCEYCLEIHPRHDTCYVAIQCKYRNGQNTSLRRNDISGFLSEMLLTDFCSGLLISTSREGLQPVAERIIRRSSKEIGQVHYARLADSETIDWSEFRFRETPLFESRKN